MAAEVKADFLQGVPDAPAKKESQVSSGTTSDESKRKTESGKLTRKQRKALKKQQLSTVSQPSQTTDGASPPSSQQPEAAKAKTPETKPAPTSAPAAAPKRSLRGPLKKTTMILKRGPQKNLEARCPWYLEHEWAVFTQPEVEAKWAAYKIAEPAERKRMFAERDKRANAYFDGDEAKITAWKVQEEKLRKEGMEKKKQRMDKMTDAEKAKEQELQAWWDEEFRKSVLLMKRFPEESKGFPENFAAFKALTDVGRSRAAGKLAKCQEKSEKLLLEVTALLDVLPEETAIRKQAKELLSDYYRG